MLKFLQVILLGSVIAYTGTILARENINHEQAQQFEKYMKESMGVMMSCAFTAGEAKGAHEKCSIKGLYPLVEKGNYFASLTIAQIYEDLGYPEEQKKWMEYTIQMETIPKSMANDLKTELEKLNNSPPVVNEKQ